MRFQAACFDAPDGLAEAFGAPIFAADVLRLVVVETFNVQDAFDRPAEYFVVAPDRGRSARHGMMGVQFRLSDISRNGRSTKMIHTAGAVLEGVVERVIQERLSLRQSCQLQVVLELIDGEIETSPGSEQYSCVIQRPAKWVNGTGV